MTNELERIWKEAVVTQLKVRSRNLPKEKLQNICVIKLLSGPRIKPVISREQS
jgi:hypothetical protein